MLEELTPQEQEVMAKLLEPMREMLKEMHRYLDKLEGKKDASH